MGGCYELLEWKSCRKPSGAAVGSRCSPEDGQAAALVIMMTTERANGAEFG